MDAVEDLDVGLDGSPFEVVEPTERPHDSGGRPTHQDRSADLGVHEPLEGVPPGEELGETAFSVLGDGGSTVRAPEVVLEALGFVVPEPVVLSLDLVDLGLRWSLPAPAVSVLVAGFPAATPLAGAVILSTPGAAGLPAGVVVVVPLGVPVFAGVVTLAGGVATLVGDAALLDAVAVAVIDAGDFRAAVDFTAVDFRAAVDFTAVDFTAVDFTAVDFTAGDFAAVDFTAGDFAAVDFTAGDFAAVDFAAGDFAAVDFTAVDFAAGDFAAPVFLAVVAAFLAAAFVPDPRLTGVALSLKALVAVLLAVFVALLAVDVAELARSPAAETAFSAVDFLPGAPLASRLPEPFRVAFPRDRTAAPTVRSCRSRSRMRSVSWATSSAGTRPTRARVRSTSKVTRATTASRF